MRRYHLAPRIQHRNMNMTTLAMTRLRHAEDVAAAYWELYHRRRAVYAALSGGCGQMLLGGIQQARQEMQQARDQLEAAEQAVTAATEAVIAERRGK